MISRRNSVGLIFCLVLVSSVTLAQVEKDKIKARAEMCVKALQTGEYNQFIEFTYPKLVELIGGKVKMIALLEKGMKGMKADGFELTAVAVQEPREVVKFGSQRFVIVPYFLTVKAPNGKITSETFLLGVADSLNAIWTFVDGQNLNDAAMKQLFPNVYGKLKLPERKPPVIQRNQ